MNEPTATKPVPAARAVLGVTGAGLVIYGLLGLPTQLGTAQLVGLLTWMAGAVLLHDGVVVPLSTVAGAGLTRIGSRLKPASAAILRGALMTGAVVSLITGTLLKAQSEARTISALEGDYAANLLWFWAVLVMAAAAAIYAIERAGRATSEKGNNRQKTRP